MYRRGLTSLILLHVCALSATVAGCSSGSAAPPVPVAVAVVANAEADAGAAAPVEPATAAADGPLCAKYGGMATVRQVTRQLLDGISADCRIRAFFSGLTGAGGQRVRDCLSLQIGELFGCAGVTYARAYADNGLECRGMRKSHIGLGITDADFDALLENVALSLTAAGVERQDLESAAGALLALRPQIVEVASAVPSRSQCGRPDAGREPGE
jgi:hypothetical protein